MQRVITAQQALESSIGKEICQFESKLMAGSAVEHIRTTRTEGMIRKSKRAIIVRPQKPSESGDSASQSMLRSARQGFPAVVFCDGKTQAEIIRLARKLLAQHRHLLVPRVTAEVARALLQLDPRARYHESARAVTIHDATRRLKGDVLIVTAGTADTPIAEEARVTAEVMGSLVEVI